MREGLIVRDEIGVAVTSLEPLLNTVQNLCGCAGACGEALLLSHVCVWSCVGASVERGRVSIEFRN